MIKTNGYYLDSPKYYEEIILGGHTRNSFHHIAYKFNDDGTFFTGSQYTDSIFINFKITDFDTLRLNKYLIRENIIHLIFDFEKDWQNTYEIKVYNESILCDKERVLTFQNWK